MEALFITSDECPIATIDNGGRAHSSTDWTIESVLATLSYGPPESSASPVPFFHLLERLKTTKREGWQQVGIQHGESIADHMYRMAIMTMCCPPSLASRLDISRCVQMSLIHDMAECLVGDITPMNTDITKPEKSRRELMTMQYITQSLIGSVPGSAAIQERLMGLFQDYEENSTLEAQFVHDVDKMEMVLQVAEYERRHFRNLSEFCHVLEAIRLPEVREWANMVVSERRLFSHGIDENYGYKWSNPISNETVGTTCTNDTNDTSDTSDASSTSGKSGVTHDDNDLPNATARKLTTQTSDDASHCIQPLIHS